MVCPITQGDHNDESYCQTSFDVSTGTLFILRRVPCYRETRRVLYVIRHCRKATMLLSHVKAFTVIIVIIIIIISTTVGCVV